MSKEQPVVSVDIPGRQCKMILYRLEKNISKFEKNNSSNLEMNDMMKNAQGVNVADMCDVRMTQVLQAMNALADNDADRCIRVLKNIMPTVRGDARVALDAAYADAEACQAAADKQYDAMMNTCGETSFQKLARMAAGYDRMPGARMFYNKTVGILIQYGLIRDW